MINEETLTQNAYLSCRQEYLRDEIFNPIPRLTFISAASPYDLDIATLPPRKKAEAGYGIISILIKIRHENWFPHVEACIPLEILVFRFFALYMSWMDI